MLVFGGFNFPLARRGLRGRALLSVGKGAVSDSGGVATGALARGGGRGGGVDPLGVRSLLPLGSCCVLPWVKLRVSVWRLAVLRCFVPVAVFPPLTG